MSHYNFRTCSVLGLTALAALLGGIRTAEAQSQPYVGQIMYTGFNFAPQGWVPCDGALLAIADQPVLYDLIGTTYGGDGVNNFAVPDMRGRMPIHVGTGFALGQQAGTETATLTFVQMPVHSHTLSFNAPLPAASAVANSTVPAAHLPGNTGRNLSYSTSAPDVSLGVSVSLSGSTSTGSAGGSQPFSILQPYLAVNCAIAANGIFPTQN